jgi:Asp-tRNA(Asn)/Glu-tRNA(Gln) amidotransferase A subunit family amidase
MGSDLYRLTATEVVARVKAGEISVTQYASSIVERIGARDDAVQAWAYFNPKYVMEQAKALDAIPASERGPLHGVAIAVKDVIYTKGESSARTSCFRTKRLTFQTCPRSSTHLYMPTTPPKSMLGT